MTEYKVIWKIDCVEANSCMDAVRKVREIQLDENSIATIFTVINKETGVKITVDFLEDKLYFLEDKLYFLEDKL